MNNEIDYGYRSHNEIRSFSPDEISQKLLLQILSHNDIKDKIQGFNENSWYQFSDSLTFQLGRAIIKHSYPSDIINWKIHIRDNGIMNDNENHETTRETFNIVNDFINAESQKAMKRILVYCDREFDGKIFKNAPTYDYDIVCSKEILNKKSSLLFDEESFSIVRSYYFEYISLFPITLTEFEIIFFYFLLFLTKEKYPGDESYGDTIYFVMRIDNIVKMRYIDIHNRLILALLNLIYTDEELSIHSHEIYHDFKKKWDATCEQAFSSEKL